MKAKTCNDIFEKVIDYYHINNTVDGSYLNPFEKETLEFLLFEKCWIDTVQWHLEDLIRNPNLNPKNGLAIKHRIDSSNQKRTDIVEKIDDYYFHFFKERSNSESRINTESP